MSVTLADIARELGLSKMTVSRAINNDPLVNAKTRERVLEVSRRLNYQPNHFARALVTNRSFLLGVIVPDLMHSYFAEILHGISSYASSANFQIVIANTEEHVSREVNEVEALRWRTDGLIIAPSLPQAKADQYREMLQSGAKIVFIDRTLEGVNCPMVTTDNVEVGLLATEHLIKLGHKQIGHLRGTNTSTSKERLEGYKQALSRKDIAFDRDLGPLRAILDQKRELRRNGPSIRVHDPVLEAPREGGAREAKRKHHGEVSHESASFFRYERLTQGQSV